MMCMEQNPVEISPRYLFKLHTWTYSSYILGFLRSTNLNMFQVDFCTLHICMHNCIFVHTRVMTYMTCCNACVQLRVLAYYTNVWGRGPKCEVIRSMEDCLCHSPTRQEGFIKDRTSSDTWEQSNKRT